MINLYFEKLYRYPRIAEPCFIGIPVRRGELWDISHVAVWQEGRQVPLQAKITSRHEDGSVRFLFLRFQADLPGNQGAVLQCDLHAKDPAPRIPMKLEQGEKGILVDTGAVAFRVASGGSGIFESLVCGTRHYRGEQFVGPLIKDGRGSEYPACIGPWEVEETGAVCTVLKARGTAAGASRRLEFELRLTAWAGKPWVEVGYRLINTSEEELHLASLVFYVLREAPSGAREGKPALPAVVLRKAQKRPDSTGQDSIEQDGAESGDVFVTTGTGELEKLEKEAPVGGVRTCAAGSNYKTTFHIGREGAFVNRVVDAEYLLWEGNEHKAEVFYGTFFADCTDEGGGVCATIFQAQQNYPKAVAADRNGIALCLVPEGVDRVVMQPGMSREQRFLLHFHEAGEPLGELDNRSLIYQMPDRPVLDPEVHRASGVYMDVFPKVRDWDVEEALTARADGHSTCYGMMNFGDSPDPGYTAQGRGGGELVWSNNEYDFPHACALQYVRTGVRRFLDYHLAACRHWMDVDVCHYSKDPLRLGGQWEHTNGHCKNGVMVCSHEWVEGLLDYYHFTGEERALQTALGIGENVLGLLDTPMYAVAGESNARETGWALRTLTALYVETWDEKWLGKCRWIVDSFKTWEEQYGGWLAPYTDNTVIRVGFMIAVAVGSLMRYYRVFPDEELKGMMLRAVDDLTKNCYLPEYGVFYYKELPSLQRLGGNTLILEALAIAYELSGNAEYLKYGRRVFYNNLNGASAGGGKKIMGDAVVVGYAGTKNFAQSFIPLITYYKAASEAGVLKGPSHYDMHTL